MSSRFRGMRTARDYQWDAALDLSTHIADGETSLGLAEPTGSGKTTILHIIMARTRHIVTGVVVAAPSLATERNFYVDEDIKVLPRAANSSTSVVKYSIRKSMFSYREDGLDKIEELNAVLSPGGSTTPYFLTTHQQLALWGEGVLPEDLKGRLLILDEAHHAGTDSESDDLNTGLGRFAKAWRARGGIVLYTTATPFRADDLDVFPEGTKVHTRSISEHASSGYAPSEFKLDTVVVGAEASTIRQFSGDALSEDENENGFSYEAMVDRWVEDGRPKAVFVVPSDNSVAWAQRLWLELRRVAPNCSIVNGVGTDKATKERFLEALDREVRAGTYAESTVDVFISCRRFDEGTDWKFCSVVYNWAIPSSFGLIIQRWGRAFRLKGADYPERHRNTATMVFFTLKASVEVLSQFEDQHHDHAFLLACYLADWKTGREYRSSLRVRFEKHWTRRPKKEVKEIDEIRIKQMLEVPEHVRNTVLGKIAHFEAALPKGAPPPTVGDIFDYLDKLTLSVDERSAAVVLLSELVENKEPPKNTRSRALPDPLVREDLLASFRAVVEEYRDQTVSVIGDVLSYYTSFTGADASEVAEMLRRWRGKSDFTETQVIDAVKRYHLRTGGYPNSNTGDATIDFGFSCSWTNVDYALRVGSRGLGGGDSLFDLLCKYGMRKPRPHLTDLIILMAAKAYYSRVGEFPNRHSKEADQDFGYPESWSAVQSALAVGGRGLTGGRTLPQLLQSHGLLEIKGRYLLTESIVKDAVGKEYKKTGRWPGRYTKGAEEYFGEGANWAAVEMALRSGFRGLPGKSSLMKIRQSLKGPQEFPRTPKGLVRDPLHVEAILSAMKQFYEKNGRYPATNSGDAFQYFGRHVSWAGIDTCLSKGMRGLPGGSSLSKLRKEHGIK